MKEPLDLNEYFEVALVEYSYRKNWMIDIDEIIVHKWNASDLNEIYRCTVVRPVNLEPFYSRFDWLSQKVNKYSLHYTITYKLC